MNKKCVWSTVPLQPKHAIIDRLTGASDSSQLHSAFRQHDHSFGSEHHGQKLLHIRSKLSQDKTRCSCRLQGTRTKPDAAACCRTHNSCHCASTIQSHWYMPCCDTRNMYAGQPQKLSLQPRVTEQNRPKRSVHASTYLHCSCLATPTVGVQCRYRPKLGSTDYSSHQLLVPTPQCKAKSLRQPQNTHFHTHAH